VAFRIRYINQPDGSKVSMRVFTDRDGLQVKVKINSDDKSGSIITAIGDIPILSYTAGSPHKIKIKLKSALKKIGVDFGSEEREDMVTRGVKRALKKLGINPEGAL